MSAPVPEDASSTLYLERLPQHDIRLLSLLPSEDIQTDVECKLYQYQASKAPRYEGLSYVWGSANELVVVRCNGVLIQVTRNLRDALQAIRSPNESKTLWVDALCINQIDIGEKNIHVPLMGRVYSHAANTIIYLGGADAEEATEAAAGLQAMYEFVVDGPYRDSSNVELFYSLFEKMSTPTLLDCSWDTIARFFSAAWFERIWCVQEILLAQDVESQSYALYGNIRIPYNVISKATLYLTVANGAMTDPFDGRFAEKDLQRATSAARMSFAERGENHLQTILQIHRNHKATDPRDKVYGLLGTFEKYGFNPAAIGVDYKKSVTAVYTDAAIEILLKGRDLELLDCVSHPKIHEFSHVHPSWVPRWDLERRHSGIYGHDTIAFQKNFSMTPQNCGRSPSDFYITRSKLLVCGFLHSKVVWTSHALFSTEARVGPRGHEFPNLEPAISEYWNQVKCFQPAHPEFHEVLSRMARTFTIGMSSPIKHFTKADNQERHQFLADFQDYIYRLSSMGLGPDKNGNYTVDAKGTTLPGYWKSYAERIEYASLGRSLFRITSGVYGLGPDCLAEGDVIVALFGGTSPYALRPNGAEFYCVGPVYVDELMDGVYFRNLQDAGEPEQEFVLI